MAGITIQDSTLHLMLLDEVLDDRDEDGVRALQRDYEKYLKKTKSKGAAWEVLEACSATSLHKAFQSFLLQLPMTKGELASLESFFVDGDHELLSWIRPGFGDTDQFRVRNLSGIEHCTGLTFLDLGLVVERTSLKPLVTLKALEKINIWWPDDVSDLDALLELPKLAAIHIANLSMSKQKRAWKPVVNALKSRGVEVT